MVTVITYILRYFFDDWSPSLVDRIWFPGHSKRGFCHSCHSPWHSSSSFLHFVRPSFSRYFLAFFFSTLLYLLSSFPPQPTYNLLAPWFSDFSSSPRASRFLSLVFSTHSPWLFKKQILSTLGDPTYENRFGFYDAPYKAKETESWHLPEDFWLFNWSFRKRLQKVGYEKCPRGNKPGKKWETSIALEF